MSAAPRRAETIPAVRIPATASLGLSQLLAMQAAMQPARPFLMDAGGRHWTFREVEAAVAHVAALLADLDVAQGSRVFLIAPNGVNAVISLLAILEAGFQPLLAPPTMAFSVLASVATAQRPAILIAEVPPGGPAAVEAAMRLAGAIDSVRFVMGFGPDLPKGVMNIGARLAGGSDAIKPPAGTEREEDATILVATGAGETIARAIEPLIGVAVDYARLAGLRGSDRLATPLPLTDAVGFASGLIAALFSGAELTLLDAPDSIAIERALEGVRPCHLVWPARLASLAIEAMLGRNRLRSITLAGEAAHSETVADLAERVIHLMSGPDGRPRVAAAGFDDPPSRDGAEARHAS